MEKIEYSLSDEVWARIVQIIQEAMLTGVDCVDIMRQVRVSEVGPGQLGLTEDYKTLVAENFKRMVAQAEEIKAQQNQGPKVLVLNEDV